ncbi:MAG: alpha/beta hydrolase [Clostridiaceae bacterium]
MIDSAVSIELPNKVKISCFERGSWEGVPMILLHGLGDSWHIFELLMQDLPQSIHAFALSQRGHGDSSRPNSGYDTGDFQGDLEMVMDALNLEKAVILGASSGGFPARSFALSHPDRTLALILLGAPATLQSNPAAQEVWESTLSKLTDPVERDFAERFLLSTLSKPIAQDFQEMLLRENLKVPARVWRDTMEGMMKEAFPGGLSKISSPTLIIRGDQDRLLTRSSQEELAKVIPGSRLVVLKDAGHLLYCEDPRGAATAIARFIDEVNQNTRGDNPV